LEIELEQILLEKKLKTFHTFIINIQKFGISKIFVCLFKK